MTSTPKCINCRNILVAHAVKPEGTMRYECDVCGWHLDINGATLIDTSQTAGLRPDGRE